MNLLLLQSITRRQIIWFPSLSDLKNLSLIMCCFFPNHLNWWFAEARRATIDFLEKACMRLSASIFCCKESDTVSCIDWNCVVASFSLGRTKLSRNFGCRATRRTDKSYCWRRWSVCSKCLGEFLPCVLQLLLKADLKLIRLCRSWSQPVGLRESWNHLSHGAVCPKPDLFRQKTRKNKG